MSIQQNINQLIGLAATATAIYQHTPSQVAKHEKETALKKTVDKENILKAKMDEAHSRDEESKKAYQAWEKKQKRRKNPKSGERGPTYDPHQINADLSNLQLEMAKVYKERYDIDPTPETYKEMQNYLDMAVRNDNIYQQAQYAKSEGYKQAVQEGQTRVQNKQQTEEFQQKIGVREKIGFKPLSEHRDFRRRLNDDTK